MNTEEYCKVMLAEATEKAKLCPELPGASYEQTAGMLKSMYTPADGMITISLPQIIWDTIDLMRQDEGDGAKRTSNVLEEGLIEIIGLILRRNPILSLTVAMMTAKKFATTDKDGTMILGKLQEIEFDS